MKIFLSILTKTTFLATLLLVSCAKKKDNTTVVSNPGVDGYYDGGYTYPTAIPTSTGTSGSDANCSGDVSDGSDDKPYDGLSNPIHIHQIGLSGKVSWSPGLPAFRPEDKSFLSASDSASCNPLSCNAADLVYDSNKPPLDPNKRSNKCYYCLKGSYNTTFINTPFSYPIPLKKDSWDKFKNDGDIFVRIKLRNPGEDNINNLGGAYCYGRLPNKYGTYVPYQKQYTKLKVDIYARVLKKTTNCNVETNCKESDFTYTATRLPVKMGYILEVNKCTSVVRIPAASLINSTAEAVVLEIGNVYTNSTCLESPGSTYCPYSQLNTANCWFATLEIATNETHFFRDQIRSNIP